jgi:hypothetical protein
MRDVIKSHYVIYIDTYAGIEWGWCAHEFWDGLLAEGSADLIRQHPELRAIDITDHTQVFVYKCQEEN